MSSSSQQQYPPPGFIDNEEEFVVEAILGEKVENGQTYYLIKWLGYDEEENTFEARDDLIIDGHRDAVEAYERGKKSSTTPNNKNKNKFTQQQNGNISKNSNGGGKSKTPIKRTITNNNNISLSSLNGNYDFTTTTAAAAAKSMITTPLTTTTTTTTSSLSPLMRGILFCGVLVVLISLSILANKEPILPSDENELLLRTGATIGPFIFLSWVLFNKRADSTSYTPRALCVVITVLILCVVDSLPGLNVINNTTTLIKPILNTMWSFLVLRTIRSHVDPPILNSSFDLLTGLTVMIFLFGWSYSAITQYQQLLTLINTTCSISAIMEGLFRTIRHEFSVPELVQLAGIFAMAHGSGQYSKTWDWNMVDRWMSCISLVVTAISIKIH
jgi:hypothetical protein